MSFSSWPRAGVLLTLGLAAVSCGGDKAGPEETVSFIEIAPKTKRMYTVGEQAIFSATITTEAGTAGEGIPIAFKSRDETLVQVNSAGIATAKKKGGSTWIVATAGDKSDSAFVEVPTTTCGSTAATTMTSGQVVTDIGVTGFCAAASTGDYAVIVHNNSLAAVGTSSIEINGVGLGTLPGGGASLSKAAPERSDLGTAIRAWRRDVAAEMRQRRMEAATIAPLAAAARTWYDGRAKRASLDVAAAPVVGDLMHVNVNITSACTDSTPVDARVAAVSSTAIVLADPRNPSDGFTDAEYNEFAQMFDSIINPLDIANFGSPTDLDNNGHVILIFTRAVNERTPNNAPFYIGGLTHSRDLIPKASCKTGNFGEMFYLLVPDPNGLVNGNKLFNKAFVNSVTDATVAHEYQHLINFARRTYLNGATAQPSEELWLNEGLSHTAEDLLFYRRSGRSPRTSFGGADLTGPTIYSQWVAYSSGNFLNYDEYVLNPTISSPFSSSDDVSTRGAASAFLRYMADRNLPSDGSFWFNLVNSGDAGVSNIQKRLGNMSTATFQGMFRDFVISSYTDDLIVGVDAKYTQPSWNMRSFYPRLHEILGSNWTATWPLTGVSLKDAETTSASLRSGGFEVYRFRGLAGSDSYVRVTGALGTAMPANITISVVRIP